MITISLFYCWEKMFILMYMDDWEKFDETLPEKRRFLQSLKYGRYY